MIRLLGAAVLLLGCEPAAPALRAAPPDEATTPAAVAAEPRPASPPPSEAEPVPPALPTPPGGEHAHVRFEPAPEGDLPPIVAAFAARARAEGRTPLVYVGATWCEPCQYFHAAAERGALDGELPPLALLELDRDRDGERIDAAGYGSRMIPLFAIPGPDGRGSGAQIEGSIHGPGSPMQIVPRLLALIAEAR
jgi:hypothetical protein